MICSGFVVGIQEMHCLPMLYNVSSILAVLILLKLDLCLAVYVSLVHYDETIITSTKSLT
mgnify:CR=1 FL=1